MTWDADYQGCRLGIEELNRFSASGLRLALLIPGDVVLGPVNKLSEFFLTRHGRVLQERVGGCQ
jgi:hypothetical protein